MLSNIPFLQFCQCKHLMLNLFLKPQLHQCLLRYDLAKVFSLPSTYFLQIQVTAVEMKSLFFLFED